MNKGGKFLKKLWCCVCGREKQANLGTYANRFMGFIEHQLFSQYNEPKPELYGRYINDCIGATYSTRDELTQLINAINTFHPALKYT